MGSQTRMAYSILEGTILMQHFRSSAWTDFLDGLYGRPTLPSRMLPDQNLLVSNLPSAVSWSHRQDLLLHSQHLRLTVHCRMPLLVTFSVQAYQELLGPHCRTEVYKHACDTCVDCGSEQLQRLLNLSVSRRHDADLGITVHTSQISSKAALEPTSTSQAALGTDLPLLGGSISMRCRRAAHVLSRSFLRILRHSL
jgi:hypothetical protein